MLEGVISEMATARSRLQRHLQGREGSCFLRFTRCTGTISDPESSSSSSDSIYILSVFGLLYNFSQLGCSRDDIRWVGVALDGPNEQCEISMASRSQEQIYHVHFSADHIIQDWPEYARPLHLASASQGDETRQK